MARRRKRNLQAISSDPGFTGLAVEVLEQRAMLSVSAFFTPGTGLLTVTGDSLNNVIEVSRNAAGSILVNNGAVSIKGGTPTVANTSQITINGAGGNDTLALNEANGALPKSQIFGGSGNDTLIGGSGADQLFGQAGNDILQGRGGADFLFGGSEKDLLIGGDGDDQVFGESGDDRLIWNPGDDTDLNEGGSGFDAIEVNGGNGDEQFTATANGTRVRFDRITPAPFALDIGTSERLVVRMNGGNDSFAATGNLAALIQLTVDGGRGNDTLLGSNGADLLLGGDGHDFLDGQQGNDVVKAGAGDDVFQWDPGDGSDVVEGQAGTDTLQFNGSAANEIFDAAANGGRLRFTRNLGNIVIDANDLERVNLQALGGADILTLNDLAGTEVAEFNVNLAGTLGGISGDAQVDTVILHGTEGNDNVEVFGSGSSVAVVGLSTLVTLTNSEGANDALVINTLAGQDAMNASTLVAGITKLTVDGGEGHDVILGSRGADVLLGGNGNDFVDGQSGNDLILAGAGNDVFQWDPGDGNDTIEGQAGDDALLFFGSNANENVNLFANGGRVLLLRDIANVTMDLDDTERVEFRALGGADNIVVGDLSGTDLTRVDLDLRGPNGGGDGQADSVTVTGTQGDDVFGAAGDSGGIAVFGLTTAINIFHQEQAFDRLTLNALGGNDVVDATSLEADGIQLTLNGGLGADVLLGSEGDDLLNGGDGDDLALMGAGADVFVWNPGDDNDTLEGQAGFDRMVFNGSNVSEQIAISANGGRLRFFRDVANVTMDANEVEALTFNALGGADVITLGDLAGTNVTDIDLNLAAVGGVGDAQPDTVIVQGTNGDDTILVVGDAGGVAVLGLAAQVNITGSEGANDRLVVNALDGDDVVEASGLAAGFIQLTADGGRGADVLIGSDGNDVLLGGEGDDVLIGGPGLDILDGGPGDDVEIQ